MYDSSTKMRVLAHLRKLKFLEMRVPGQNGKSNHNHFYKRVLLKKYTEGVDYREYLANLPKKIPASKHYTEDV